VRAKDLYEYYAPTFYFRPGDSASSLVRENWIRAKYVRKEFMQSEADAKNSAIFAMPERPLMGWLSKQNESGKWQKRYFVLRHRYLAYFTAATDSYAKGRLDVTDLEVFVPETPQTEKRFEFHIKMSSGRNYPIIAENTEDMFRWAHAIRRAKIYFTTVRPAEVKARGSVEKIPHLEMKSLKSGWLTKQGGKWKSWTKRWCVLTEEYLYYFKKEPLLSEEIPEGGLHLRDIEILAADEKILGKKHCFLLIGADRIYYAVAASAPEMETWTAAINSRIEKLRPREDIDYTKVK